jgi:D-glycero-D-manno-heptose 1,7-bisphosphate phosphatase
MNMLDLNKVNKKWTLFLDRDGVINHEKDTYVFTVEEFRFYDGALEALKKFNEVFNHIIIATNQRGVGRELMTEADLLLIHDSMVKEIIGSGGRIDKIYYSISMDDAHPNRKPNPGMGLDAMKDHPRISKDHSIMVGNNMSDMQFGKNAGFHTVLLTTTGTRVDLPHPLVDMQFDSLLDFANALPSTT